MLQEKIATARRISLSINTLERRGTSQIEQSLELASSILAARKAHNLPDTFATGAVLRATTAAARFAEGSHELAQCHRHLAADQIEFGVTPGMVGDNVPCMTAAPDGQVAGAATTGTRPRLVA